MKFFTPPWPCTATRAFINHSSHLINLFLTPYLRSSCNPWTIPISIPPLPPIPNSPIIFPITFSLSNHHTHFLLTCVEPCIPSCPPCPRLAHLHRNPKATHLHAWEPCMQGQPHGCRSSTPSAAPASQPVRPHLLQPSPASHYSFKNPDQGPCQRRPRRWNLPRWQRHHHRRDHPPASCLDLCGRPISEGRCRRHAPLHLRRRQEVHPRLRLPCRWPSHRSSVAVSGEFERRERGWV